MRKSPCYLLADGFYLPGHGTPTTLHSQPSLSRTPAAPLSTSLSREKDVLLLGKGSKDACREKSHKGETGGALPRRDREKPRDEGRPLSVVDLTQDRPEEERRPPHSSPLFPDPAAESKPRIPAPPPPLVTCRTIAPHSKYLGPEPERFSRTAGPDEDDKLRKCELAARVPCVCPSPHGTPALPPPRLPPPSLFPLHGTAKEHRIIAPTFVPSVEVYDERSGPIQIASQARDRPGERECSRYEPGRHPHVPEPVREEGSVIRANTAALKRLAAPEGYPKKAGHSPEGSSKEASRVGPESEPWNPERERPQRAPTREASKVAHGAEPFASPDLKWKPFEMGNFASSQMAALIAQHGHMGRPEEDGKKTYLDPPVTSRPAGSGSEGEVSAMQSLIKYSGSFSRDPARPASDSKNPFGGLGCVKVEAGAPGSSRVQHLPPQQPAKQLRRDPERPDSAKSFGRESIGPQGEVEVRHPPVGIAVAVARQRDNSGKLGSIKGTRSPSISITH